jgi:hypothetical protein
MRNEYRVLAGNPEEKRPLGRLGIAERIILRCISERKMG